MDVAEFEFSNRQARTEAGRVAGASGKRIKIRSFFNGRTKGYRMIRGGQEFSRVGLFGKILIG